MRAVLTIPMSSPDLSPASISAPINEWLQSNAMGKVDCHHELPAFEVEICLTLRNRKAYEHLIQYLDENSVPSGTMIYRTGWFGKHQDIRLFYGEMVDDPSE